MTLIEKIQNVFPHAADIPEALLMDREYMNEEKKNAGSKADFMTLAGIGAELAEFVTEFIESPERFFSISTTASIILEAGLCEVS